MSLIQQMQDPETFSNLVEAGKAFGEKNDCTVKAVAAICDVSYEEAHEALKKAGRKNKQGAEDHVTIKAVKLLGFEMRNNTNSIEMMIRKRMPEKHKGIENLTTYHPRRFPQAWSKVPKRMLLTCSKHIAAYRNGRVIDYTQRKACRIKNFYVVIEKRKEKKAFGAEEQFETMMKILKK